MGVCGSGVKEIAVGVMNPRVPATPSKGFKVCVCGGAGGIGQPLCLLMAMNPLVKELAVYDLTISMVPAAGVAKDLSHIERRCQVTSYSLERDQKPIDHLKECLKDCHLVLVPAGVPRKPGQDRQDLLKINAGIAKSIVEACAKFCPKAVLGLIVNPVNAVVPAMGELYKKAGLDPMKVCGITTLDIVRANKFVHNETGAPIENLDVQVIGGHAGKSILPLFSKTKECKKLSAEKIASLDEKVQNAGTEVVQAKNGKGSATLSMAYAGARFGNAVLHGLAGTKVTECAYVKIGSNKDGFGGLDYFATKVTFGPNGVHEVHPLDTKGLSQHEKTRFDEAVSHLKAEIQDGMTYASENELSSLSLAD